MYVVSFSFFQNILTSYLGKAAFHSLPVECGFDHPMRRPRKEKWLPLLPGVRYMTTFRRISTLLHTDVQLPQKSAFSSLIYLTGDDDEVSYIPRFRFPRGAPYNRGFLGLFTICSTPRRLRHL